MPTIINRTWRRLWSPSFRNRTSASQNQSQKNCSWLAPSPMERLQSFLGGGKPLPWRNCKASMEWYLLADGRQVPISSATHLVWSLLVWDPHFTFQCYGILLFWTSTYFLGSLWELILSNNMNLCIFRFCVDSFKGWWLFHWAGNSWSSSQNETHVSNVAFLLNSFYFLNQPKITQHWVESSHGDCWCSECTVSVTCPRGTATADSEPWAYITITQATLHLGTQGCCWAIHTFGPVACIHSYSILQNHFIFIKFHLCISY